MRPLPFALSVSKAWSPAILWPRTPARDWLFIGPSSFALARAGEPDTSSANAAAGGTTVRCAHVRVRAPVRVPRGQIIRFLREGPSLPAYSVECRDRFADERGPVRALPSPPSHHCVRVVTKKSRGPRCRAQTGHLYSNRAPCACRGHRTQRLRPVPGPIAAAGSSGICFAALPKRATRPRRAPQCGRRRARACGLPWLVPSWRGTYCSEGVGKGCGTGPFGVPRAFAPERILDALRRHKSAVAPAGSPAPVGRRCVVWAALVPNSHPNEFGLPSRVGSGAP